MNDSPDRSIATRALRALSSVRGLVCFGPVHTRACASSNIGLGPALSCKNEPLACLSVTTAVQATVTLLEKLTLRCCEECLDMCSKRTPLKVLIRRAEHLCIPVGWNV